jgi:hypothetical protein
MQPVGLHGHVMRGAMTIVSVAIAACVATPPAVSIAPDGSGPPVTATVRPTVPPFRSPAASGPALPNSIALRCGSAEDPLDLNECLRVADRSASGAVGVDVRTITAIAVTVVEASGATTASPLPSPSVVTVGAATITFEGHLTPTYRVDFTAVTGSFSISVYVGDGGELGVGPALSQVRNYGVDGSLTAWTEPGTFRLDEANFVISGSCGGSAASPGGGTVHLERVAADGQAVEVGRARCGPATGGDAFQVNLTVEAGDYRVRLEDVARGLDFTIAPLAETR